MKTVILKAIPLSEKLAVLRRYQVEAVAKQTDNGNLCAEVLEEIIEDVRARHSYVLDN